MINLDAATKSLEVKLAGAITTSQLDCTCHAVDTLSSDQSISAFPDTNIATNGATAVTVMAAPAAGHTREVKTVTVYNKDTVSAVVTLQINDNGTKYIICATTLSPGDTLIYTSED